MCDLGHNLDSLYLVVVLLVPLVDVSGQGGNELAGIGLSEGIEGVALGKRRLSIGRTMLHLPGTWGLGNSVYLVHGEQRVPLLKELVKVVCHFHLCLWHLIAEGES